MRNAPRTDRLRRALLVPAAIIPMIALMPATASADPTTPATPTTTTTAPQAPSKPQTPATTAPTTTSPSPTTAVTTVAPSTTTTTTVPPQGPPGRLTVGAVRIVDEAGAPVSGATAFVQGCSGGPGATLSDGGATTVTGQCVVARIDHTPVNWRLLSPSSQTITTTSGRAEFRFVFARGGIVPPPTTTTTPPPNRTVRFTLAARDQDGRGVPSEYAVAECDTWRPLGGARTDSAGNGGGEFPRGCVSVVPTAWPSSCVLIGPNAFSRVEGNGVSRLAFRFRCGVTIPPGEVETNGTLVKTDRITGAPLAGASFVISRCGSDEAVRAVTTGANGVAAFSVAPGCYKATETAAPAGYVRDSAAVAFQVLLTPQFQVRVTNSKIDAGPVVRNLEVRVPISSIPSGRVF